MVRRAGELRGVRKARAVAPATAWVAVTGPRARIAASAVADDEGRVTAEEESWLGSYLSVLAKRGSILTLQAGGTSLVAAGVPKVGIPSEYVPTAVARDVPGAAAGVLETNGPFDRRRPRLGREVAEGDGTAQAVRAAVDVTVAAIVAPSAAHRVGAGHATGQGGAAIWAAP